MRFIGLLMVAGVIGFSHSAEGQEWEVYEGYAVVKNGTKEKLVFSDTDAQDLDEFVDLCREVCTSGEGDGPRGACGGFVVNSQIGRRRHRGCAYSSWLVLNPMQDRGRIPTSW